MGCDLIQTEINRKYYDFNPRTRMGCDRKILDQILDDGDFNPRTRMGCDDVVNFIRIQYNNFNPRTRMGCDSGDSKQVTNKELFQSTHPHGVRLTRR